MRHERETRRKQEKESSYGREKSDEGYYVVRVVLVFLLKRSSSICVVDSLAFWPMASSRGRLLPKEKILQRSPAPCLGRLATADALGDTSLGFSRQTVKYWSMAWDWETSLGRTVLAGVDGLSDETIQSCGSRPPSGPGGVPCGNAANEGDGDKPREPRELVLECPKRWLGVLGLYYGNGFD
jgi:hypothetical protein